MTLICATHHNGVPVLIGDVLISGPRDGNEPIATFDDVSRIVKKHSPDKVAGTHCKLIILRPCFAFGWTGLRIGAEALIKHLEQELPLSPTVDALAASLASFFETGPSELSIVGSLVQSREWWNFHWDGRTGALELGEQFVAGTGAKKISSLLNDVFDHDHEYREIPPTNPATLAAAWATQLISELFSDEVMYGENLEDFFGGGFDVVYFDYGGFKRAASITQLFAEIEVLQLDHGQRPNYKFGFNATSMWQHCATSTLVVERIDLSKGRALHNASHNIWRSRIRVVKRSNVSKFDQDKRVSSKVDLLRFVVLHVRVQVRNGEFGSGSIVYLSDSSDFKVIRHQRWIEIRLAKAAIDSIFQSVHPRVSAKSSVGDFVRSELRKPRAQQGSLEMLSKPK